MSSAASLWEKVMDWYDALSRSQRDAIDQTLHFIFLGLVPAAIATAAASWGLNHWREFVKQAPIERIADTQVVRIAPASA